MEEILCRIWDNLGDRLGGPMTFRFLVQPLVALFLGVRDGLRLGASGTSLFGLREHRESGGGHPLVRTVWHSIRLLVLIALILDLVYQYFVQNWIYPGEAVLVSITITVIPYLLACSIVSAFACWRASTIAHKHLSSIRRL